MRSTTPDFRYIIVDEETGEAYNGWGMLERYTGITQSAAKSKAYKGRFSAYHRFEFGFKKRDDYMSLEKRRELHEHEYELEIEYEILAETQKKIKELEKLISDMKTDL